MCWGSGSSGEKCLSKLKSKLPKLSNFLLLWWEHQWPHRVLQCWEPKLTLFSCNSMKNNHVLRNSLENVSYGLSFGNSVFIYEHYFPMDLSPFWKQFSTISHRLLTVLQGSVSQTGAELGGTKNVDRLGFTEDRIEKHSYRRIWSR